MGNLYDQGQSVTVPAVAGATFKGVYAAQERTMWCWAACAQMVLAQMGVSPIPKQCEVAAKGFGEDCCAAPDPCNRPYPMHQIETLYQMLGVSSRGIHGPIQESALMEEVFQGRPVQIGYMYQNQVVGHVVVVIGEQTRRRNGQKYLRLADPREKNGKQTVLFADVQTDSGKGRWEWTWIRMERKAS